MLCTKFVLAAVFVFAAISTGTNAYSASEGGRLTNLAAVTEEANFIFAGRVVDVIYRMSDIRSKEETSFPFAIVTYEVQNVIRGKTPGNTFTMLIMGGPDGRGRFLELSEMPKFQIGDKDLMFLSGNGEEQCPIVGCQWGRFRLLDGRVYDTVGAPVKIIDHKWIVARGLPPEALRVFRYPTPRFDELISNPEVQELMKENNMTIDEARKRYEVEAPKFVEIYTETTDEVGVEEDNTRTSILPGIKVIPENVRSLAQITANLSIEPISIDEFVSTIQEIQRGITRQPAFIPSIDPKMPIFVAKSVDESPLKLEQANEIKQLTKQDAAELEALQNQDFNPVLKAK
ncbi:MAG: hypothetical protein JW841_03435 [Deltaproteobacteria bacterium]|nr:hypothetical protein [Deltaproteobacteria bacterium]